MLLQSVAWVGMMIEYSRDGSIALAARKTFDGNHPCCLCKAIAAGKKSQQKKEYSLQLQKLEFPLLRENIAIHAPARIQSFAPILLPRSAFAREPLTPPPRASVG